MQKQDTVFQLQQSKWQSGKKRMFLSKIELFKKNIKKDQRQMEQCAQILTNQL